MGRNGYPVSDSVATISPWTNEYDIPRRPITCIITLIKPIHWPTKESITACKPMVHIRLLVEANAKRVIQHVV